MILKKDLDIFQSWLICFCFHAPKILRLAISGGEIVLDWSTQDKFKLCMAMVILFRLWTLEFQSNHDVLIDPIFYFIFFWNRFQRKNIIWSMAEGWSRSMILLAIISNHLVIHKSNLIASGLFMKSIYLSRLENVGDIGVIGYVLSRLGIQFTSTK